MNEFIFSILQGIGQTLEVIGVLCIVVGFIIATVLAVQRFRHEKNRHHGLFRFYRHSLARSVLLGLEFLVAGDIIRTVTGDLTLEGVAILGGVVIIRIILGITLEAELSDELPVFGKQAKLKK